VKPTFLRCVLGVSMMIACTGGSPGLAGDTSKAAKLRELATLTGAQERARQRIETHKRQAQEIASLVLEEARNQGADAPTFKKIEAAYSRFLEKSVAPWTAEQESVLFADLLGKHLEEDDVDAALEFYRTPAGARFSASLNAARAEWQELTGRKSQEAIMANYKVFLLEVGEIQHGSANE
jgi:isocitrate dehydrogenase kinase/phosphatase